MSQNTLTQRLEQAEKYLNEAEALLIGSGAGLSASAGYDFTNKKDFAKDYPGMLQYGFTSKLDMMANFSVPYELLWGYYLQHVKETRFTSGINKTYQDLLSIAIEKSNYFVITTNADGLFERNNFDKERIYTPQGDYKLVQCLQPCTQDTWNIEPLIKRYLPLVDKTTQKLPKNEVPTCPNCGGPVFLNVRGGDWFVEEPWLDGRTCYKGWLDENQNKKIVVLDIGSGFNTPGWVRMPAERIVRLNTSARLIRLNMYNPEVPQDIISRAVSFSEPANEVLAAITTSSIV